MFRSSRWGVVAALINRKDEISIDELTGLMAGGSELQQLSREFESMGGAAAAAAGQVLEEEVDELGIPGKPSSGA